jgi:DNA-binding NtrC family response regulator
MESLDKILCVDDDRFILVLLDAFLRGHFQVALAGSASEALALLESQGPFRIVLSDYDMPGMKGIEFLCQVAQRWPETTRILMSGGTMDMDQLEQALDRGDISRFHAKPCRIKQLCEQLRDDCQTVK